mmetsp:Transcript_6366/g.8253  ORF Transcript_6366/g.8253 Transcript_6366/m.8253 type:complete len:428 (+) Transcript_6366:241-1524(+)
MFDKFTIVVFILGLMDKEVHLPLFVANSDLCVHLVNELMDVSKDIICCVGSEELSCFAKTSVVKVIHSASNVFLLGLFLTLSGAHVSNISTSVDGTSAVSTGSFLSGLLFLLSISLLLDSGVTIGEFLLDILIRCDLTLHPWVTDNISKRKSVSGDQLKHVGNEILELISVEVSSLVSRVGFPEEVSSVHSKKLEVLVLRRCTLERRVTRVHNEQNNGGSEEIYHVSLIWLSLMNFRSHVALSSKFSLEHAAAVTALNRSGKTEVSDLNVEVFVKQDILGLKISVSNTIVVDVVKGRKNLFEVEAADSFMELTSGGDKVEEFTTLNELKNDVSSIDLLAGALLPDTVSVIFNQVYNVGMAEVLHNLDLGLNKLQSLSVVRWVGTVHNLDSVLLVAIIEGKLDLGTDTSTKSSSHIIVSNFRWHYCLV